MGLISKIKVLLSRDKRRNSEVKYSPSNPNFRKLMRFYSYAHPDVMLNHIRFGKEIIEHMIIYKNDTLFYVYTLDTYNRSNERGEMIQEPCSHITEWYYDIEIIKRLSYHYTKYENIIRLCQYTNEDELLKVKKHLIEIVNMYCKINNLERQSIFVNVELDFEGIKIVTKDKLSNKIITYYLTIDEYNNLSNDILNYNNNMHSVENGMPKEVYEAIREGYFRENGDTIDNKIHLEIFENYAKRVLGKNDIKIINFNINDPKIVIKFEEMSNNEVINKSCSIEFDDIMDLVKEKVYEL